MIEQLDQTTVGEIVATDFRAAAVFERFGIDFCCGGRRSVADACRTAAVDPTDLAAALSALAAEASSDDDVTAWSVARLVDHVVKRHHGYVRRVAPALTQYLDKLVQVHGQRHPELARVGAEFAVVRQELEQHMMKEEQVLFPYVCRMADLRAEGRPLPPSPFGTVQNPIRMMEREHRDAADEMRLIRELTNGYAVPADGCTTYKVCFSELQEFERDLHRHVHLENNVLFPKAVALENL
ncbi:MAG: iron-sulfur cluster repair di-iron protein [Betaproteobacteria bacterium]